MRLIKYMLILLLLLGGYFFFTQKDINKESAMDKASEFIMQKKNELLMKKSPEKHLLSNMLEGEIYDWVGKSKEDLINSLGEPVREDLSAYGYTWLVYTDETEQYLQFGVLNNKIQTIYATGNNIAADPIKLGDSYQSIQNNFKIEDKVSYSKDISSYTFYLNNEDLKMRPLIKMSNNLFAQLYFDVFTGQLTAIRLLTGDILIKHQPYKVEYRGEIPEEPHLTPENWAMVENGMEKQIFNITNVMRNYYQKSKLQWDDTVSEVARLHSKDMFSNNYFSHYGLDGTGLKERLAAKEVFYIQAGENIAAKYPDAPAAMIGWLNSEGHREALLNEEYTHLGVGVYRFYYTQNYLGKP